MITGLDGSKKLGGTRTCRICGCFYSIGGVPHDCLPASSIQKVQMSIEAAEEFFGGIPVISDRRSALAEWFSELRNILEIPKEKIYSIDATTEYSPSDKTLKMAAAIVNQINYIGERHSVVTEEQYLKLKSIIMPNLENNVLKGKDKLTLIV